MMLFLQILFFYLITGALSIIIDLIFFSDLKKAMLMIALKRSVKLSAELWFYWILGTLMIGPMALFSKLYHVAKYKHPFGGSPKGVSDTLIKLINECSSDYSEREFSLTEFKHDDKSISFKDEVKFIWKPNPSQYDLIDLKFDFGMWISISYVAFLSENEHDTLDSLIHTVINRTIVGAFSEDDSEKEYPMLYWAIKGNLKHRVV